MMSGSALRVAIAVAIFAEAHSQCFGSARFRVFYGYADTKDGAPAADEPADKWDNLTLGDTSPVNSTGEADEPVEPDSERGILQIEEMGDAKKQGIVTKNSGFKDYFRGKLKPVQPAQFAADEFKEMKEIALDAQGAWRTQVEAKGLEWMQGYCGQANKAAMSSEVANNYTKEDAEEYEELIYCKDKCGKDKECTPQDIAGNKSCATQQCQLDPEEVFAAAKPTCVAVSTGKGGMKSSSLRTKRKIGVGKNALDPKGVAARVEARDTWDYACQVQVNGKPVDKNKLQASTCKDYDGQAYVKNIENFSGDLGRQIAAIREDLGLLSTSLEAAH